LCSAAISHRVTIAAKLSKRDRAQPTEYNSELMETGLRGRVAIVAASSQGIGRATAAALAAEGCRVAMCARSRQTLEASTQEIRKQSGAEVFSQDFDVTDAG